MTTADPRPTRGPRPGNRARPATAADAARTDAPRWIVPATLATAAAGLAVSVYLTIAHYTQAVTLACPATGAIDCQKVTTSPESMLLGIPVAVLGLVFFAAMGVLGLPAAWNARAPWLRTARVLLAVAGVCFVARLVYAELFEIDAICLWCTVVHVLTIALFAITALATAATATLAEPA